MVSRFWDLSGCKTLAQGLNSVLAFVLATWLILTVVKQPPFRISLPPSLLSISSPLPQVQQPDNGGSSSGGGGGYSGGGSGTHAEQAGGGGGSYCSGASCKGITGGNSDENGFVAVTFLDS